MQSWKRKKKTYQPRQKIQKIRSIVFLAFFYALLTVGLALGNFPSIWNQWVGADSRLVIPEHPFRLGLDLQGGTHLVYAADMSQIPEDQREEALFGVRDVIERRVNAFGVSEPLVQTTSSGDTYRLIVELAGVLDVNSAIAQIGETPILEFKEVNTDVAEQDITDENRAALEEKQIAERQIAQEALNRVKSGESFETVLQEATGENLPAVTAGHPFYGSFVEEVTRRGLKPGSVIPVVIEDEEGLHIVRFTEIISSQRMQLAQLVICFEGKINCPNPLSAIEANIQIEEAREEATADNFADLVVQYSTDTTTKEQGGDLGWVEPGTLVPALELEALNTEIGGISSVVETDAGYVFLLKKTQEPVTAYVFSRINFPLSTINDIVPPLEPWKNTLLSGKNLQHSTVQFDPNTNIPYVSLEFDQEGGELFAQITQRNVGEYIAVFLDSQPISVPVVNQAIYGGQAVIQGNFTLEEAKLLSQRLNAGALPVPIELISQQTVGPTLGKISLEKSVQAGFIGLLLVAVFMVVIYRFSGFVAVLALLLYAFLNVTAYKFFGVTMTLAGIAGFVLSLGIAVDANVLIFERIKEERRGGRDLRSALDEGFKRAWPAIRDGNLTTLIASAVLYGFSSSFIKGFAVTLSIGVILSLFTAMTVTRTYLALAYRFPFFQKKGWGHHKSL